MAKISVTVARKRAEPNYGSTLFSLSTEVDVPVDGPQEYAARVATLFAEVSDTLDREIAERSKPQTYSVARRDFWEGSGGNGGHAVPQSRDRAHKNAFGGNGGQTQQAAVAVQPAPQQPADGTAPSTPKQVKYLLQLARRAGMRTQSELNGWIATNLGVVGKTAYQLNRSEASKAIDILNGGGR
jgi:hypothetical protein